MRAEKEGLGWVPVKPGPKQKEREHMRAEKEPISPQNLFFEQLIAIKKGSNISLNTKVLS